MGELIKLKNIHTIEREFRSDIDRNIKLHFLEKKIDRIESAGFFKRLLWVFTGVS